jgi:virginiamycin B lyase
VFSASIKPRYEAATEVHMLFLSRRVIVRSFPILALLLFFGSSRYASAPASAAPIITEIALPPNSATTNGGPEGITVGPDGKLWFTLVGLNAIGSMTTTPDHTLTQYPIPTFRSDPIDIHQGPDGQGGTALWFAEYTSNKIGRVTTSGTLTEFTDPGVTATTQGTWMVTGGPDGNIWFAEYFNHSIGRMAPNGTNYVSFNITNSGSFPSEIIPGPDGNLWFADEGNGSIGRITTAGVITEFFIRASSGPCGLTVGPDGNIWFGEQDSPGGLPGKYIGKITPLGVFTEYPTPSTNAGTIEMTTGPDGNIWFAEAVANKVAKSTLSGQITEYSTPTLLSGPYGVVAGPDHRLWFTENTGNAIGILPMAQIFLPVVMR